MKYGGVFVESAQKKVSDAQLRASKKYANGKYRPNVFMDKDEEPIIKNRMNELGYKTFNEYVGALIEYDMQHKVCPGKCE